MILGLELVLVAVMLSDLAIIGAGRIDTCIRIAAAQGAMLGILPILLAFIPEAGGAPHGAETTHTAAASFLGFFTSSVGGRVAFLSAMSFVVKGIVFPYLLFNSLRAADIRQEVDPLIGYGLSVVVAIILLGISFWVAGQMQLPHPPPSALALPAALATTLIGLQLIVSRRRAILQTVGYLVMENGIFIFGVTLAHKQPILVEMGVLLDVFVAVFVMGITIFHISREFDHQDADQLSELRD